MHRRTTLFVGSTVGLALLNVSALTPPTTVMAAILGLTVVLFLRKTPLQHLKVSVFLLAEISPISLWASLPVALVYQGLCALLLITMLPLPDRRSGMMPYRKTALQTGALVAAPLVLFTILLQTRAVGLSANQVMSLCVAVLLAVICVILAAAQYEIRLFEEVEQ